MNFANLTKEEAFLWELALTWRNPQLPEVPEALDWEKVVEIGRANKMAMLLDQVLHQMEAIDYLSQSARESLQEGREKFAKKGRELSAVLRDYMPLAQKAGLDTMPLKGLWVSHHLYQNVAMRPGHDLDILVPRERLDDAIGLLESIGFGRYWPDALADEFYKRHHLHLELSLPDCWTWVEIHWAFDHPRTLLTIDYDEVLARSTAGELLGAPVRDPNPVDLLLYLCVHLVKHMVHLPVTYQQQDLPRLILAEGRLMYFLDVAEAVKKYEAELDWKLLLKIAADYGAEDILGSVLHVCRHYLEAPVPDCVLSELRVAKPGAIRTGLWRRTAEHSLATYLQQPTSLLWRYLVAENFKFVFRPIRLLDFFTFAFPEKGFLKRRYGRSEGVAGRHLTQATAGLFRLGFDTLYYSWQRRFGTVPTFVTRHD